MILEGYFGGGATFGPRFSHAAFGGGGLPNLKGGDPSWHPARLVRIGVGRLWNVLFLIAISASFFVSILATFCIQKHQK